MAKEADTGLFWCHYPSTVADDRLWHKAEIDPISQAVRCLIRGFRESSRLFAGHRYRSGKRPVWSSQKCRYVGL